MAAMSQYLAVAVDGEQGGESESSNPLRTPLDGGGNEDGALVALVSDEDATGDLWSGCIALLRCMVGPAALYIPKGFSDAGIGGSLLIFVACNALFALGITRLVDSWRYLKSKEVAGSPSVGLDGLGRAMAGPWCDALGKFCIVAMQCGDCVTYFIFVAENLRDLLPSSWFTSIAVLIGLMALVEAPLALTKRIQKLHFLNALGRVGKG